MLVYRLMYAQQLVEVGLPFFWDTLYFPTFVPLIACWCALGNCIAHLRAWIVSVFRPHLRSVLRLCAPDWPEISSKTAQLCSLAYNERFHHGTTLPNFLATLHLIENKEIMIIRDTKNFSILHRNGKMTNQTREFPGISKLNFMNFTKFMITQITRKPVF